MPAMLKKIFYAAIMILLSVGMALLIGEGVIRILYKDTMVLFPRYFTDRWYGEYHMRSARPNMTFTHRSPDGIFHFETNEQGFRNREATPYAKRPNELRVLVLGDSHTFGYEVNQEQTYSAVTEKRLREKGIDATVINAGLSGTGTGEQLVFLEQEGMRYQPDYVVLGFFSNDFDDNLKSAFFKLDQQDSLVIDHKEHIPGVKIQNFIYQFACIRWLSEHSYLYNFVFNTVWDLFKNRSLEKGKQDVREMATSGMEIKNSYALELEKKLLARMKKVLSGKSTFIILDIPNLDGSSSVPADLLPSFRSAADTLFYAPEMKTALSAIGLTHVPHGQRHISALTHNLFGEKIAAYIALAHKGLQKP